MQPEKKVKDKIKREMSKTFPDAWSYMPVQTGYGQHGIPDHIFCVPVEITQDMVGSNFGMFVAIEAKTETGRLSKFQAVQLDKIKCAGGIAQVVFGVDEVSESIDRIKKDLMFDHA